MQLIRRAGPGPALLAAVVLAGCAQPAPPVEPAVEGDLLTSRVVEFDADGYARVPVAALSDRPIELRRFAGWYGAAEPATGPAATVEPGRVHLAVARSTGCRTPTGVEVRRSGDDLRVAFTGGDDHPECYRPVGPAAVLDLAAADVAGARTVDGRPPVAPTGPGVLTAFHEVAAGPAVAAELGTGDGELSAAVAADPPARAALDRPVPGGARAFGFVLPGCDDTGAVLLLGDDRITAEPTGGAALCDAPRWFLATFDVPADLVDDGTAPAVGT